VSLSQEGEGEGEGEGLGDRDNVPNTIDFVLKSSLRSFMSLASKRRIWWLIKVWYSKLRKDQTSSVSIFIKGNLGPGLFRRPPKINGHVYKAKC
jgi:hypothetical protein